jgi:hypothetical protein
MGDNRVSEDETRAFHPIEEAQDEKENDESQP